MIMLALEKLHCTPREALQRIRTSPELTELMAYYVLEAEDQKARQPRGAKRAGAPLP